MWGDVTPSPLQNSASASGRGPSRSSKPKPGPAVPDEMEQAVGDVRSAGTRGRIWHLPNQVFRRVDHLSLTEPGRQVAVSMLHVDSEPRDLNTTWRRGRFGPATPFPFLAQDHPGWPAEVRWLP